MEDLFDHAEKAEAYKLHRKDDPETSRDAAAAVAKKLTQIQEEVLAYALKRADLGFTDEQLTQAFYAQGRSTYRTRRAELTARGLIVDSGRRRVNGPGRRHTVWIHAQCANREGEAA
jgi:hypothetical protein